MDFIDGNGTAKQVTTYVEKDVSESKKNNGKGAITWRGTCCQSCFQQKAIRLFI